MKFNHRRIRPAAVLLAFASASSLMSACSSSDEGAIQIQSNATAACTDGKRPGVVLNIREGINNQDEDEAKQVIAAINGGNVPLADYSSKNQYGQFTFVVSRPDGIYASDILEPGNVDVGYIVYNQYGTSWFKKRTCDTLLAAGKRGVDLLLVGDHMADIDPTSPDIGTPAARAEFEACIAELTHLVPLANNTAAPTTITGLLGGAASAPVTYLDALRASTLLNTVTDVTAATSPLAGGTTPVAVAFERTPAGPRTIALNFRISRADTAEGRERLTAGLSAAVAALRGCSREPFIPRQELPVCTTPLITTDCACDANQGLFVTTDPNSPKACCPKFNYWSTERAQCEPVPCTPADPGRVRGLGPQDPKNMYVDGCVCDAAQGLQLTTDPSTPTACCPQYNYWVVDRSRCEPVPCTPADPGRVRGLGPQDPRNMYVDGCICDAAQGLELTTDPSTPTACCPQYNYWVVDRLRCEPVPCTPADPGRGDIVNGQPKCP